MRRLRLVPRETALSNTWVPNPGTWEEPLLAPGGAGARRPLGPHEAPPLHRPSPAPSRPSHGGARPLQAPLTAQAQSHAPSAAPGAVRPPRRSGAASAGGRPPLAVWGRALWGSVSAPERGQRPSWVPQVSAAAGRRGPGRGAPPPFGARLTRAGLGGGRGRCSCGRGGGRGARRSDPDARPGQRAPSPRHAGSGTPVSGGGGAGLGASGHPQGPPVDVGRRRLLPRSPGTGALLINCAVPSTRGGEPGAGLPVGGARAAEGTGSRRGVGREFRSKSGARFRAGAGWW